MAQSRSFDELYPRQELTRPTGSGLFDNLPEGPGALTEGWRSGVAGLKAAGGGLLGLAGRGLGVRGLEDYGLGIAARANEEAASYARNVQDVSSIGEGVDFAKYALGTALPSLLLTLGSAVAGRGVGALAARKITEEATRGLIKNAGMIGGAAAGSVGLEAGSIFPEAVDEGVESPVLRAITGGIAAGSLDLIPELYAARKLGLLGKAAGGVPGVERGRLANAAVQGGKFAAIESGTETAQTAIERLAAGKSLTDADAVSDYLNAAAIGAIAGGAFGAPVGAIQGGRRAAVTPETEQPDVVPEVTPAGTPSLGTVQPSSGIPVEPSDATQEFPLSTSELSAARAPLAEAKDRADTQVAALEAELALPPAQRAGRTKSKITKDLMAARVIQDAASKQLRDIDLSITDAQIAASRAVERGPLTGAGQEIAPAQPIVSPDRPISPPAERSITTPEQDQFFAERTPPVQRTAEQLLTMREAQRAQEQAAAQTQGLVVPETTTQPRERLRQATPQEKQETFVKRSADIVDAQVRSMVEQQVLTEKQANKVSLLIRKELQNVTSQPDVPAARAKLEEAIYNAFPKSFPKQDVVTFADQLLEKLGQQPREFLSKDAIGRDGRRDSDRVAAKLESNIAEFDSQVRTELADPEEPTTPAEVLKGAVSWAASAGIDQGSFRRALYTRWRADLDPRMQRLAQSILTRAEELNSLAGTDAANEQQAELGQQPKEFLSKGNIQSPEFQAWFAGSQITNGDGTPKQLYHGTKADFAQFKDIGAGLVGRLTGSDRRGEFFFTDSPEVASDYAVTRQAGTSGANVRPVYLSLKNPAVMQAFKGVSIRGAIDSAKQAGNDGLIIRNYKDSPGSGDMYVVFDARNITSALSPMQSLAGTDAANAQQAELGRQVTDRIRHLLGEGSATELRFFTQRDPTGFAGRFRTGEIKDYIELALNAKDIMSTANHESFHKIETRFLTKQDRALLRKELKKGSTLFNRVMDAARRYDAENKTNIADEIDMVPQEAHAYGFEMWKRGELEVSGTLKRIFEKIKLVLQKIKNYIDGLGFRSVEDLYRAIDMGQYARRTENPLIATDVSKAYDLIDESQGGTNRPDTLAPVWYSQLERVVDGVKLNSADSKQWLATLKGRVKPDEMKWSGVEDYMELVTSIQERARKGEELSEIEQKLLKAHPSNKIWKDPLLAFVRQNGVRIEEKVLGEDVYKELPPGWAVKQGRTGKWVAFNADGKPIGGSADTREEAVRIGLDFANDVMPSTKFDRPDLVLPGGENYREVLLMLPRVDGYAVVRNATGERIIFKTENEASDYIDANRKSGLGGEFTIEYPDPEKSFRSSHFQEPNVLAHVRLNERRDAEGKRVLFLEEIQSDLAKMWRDKYKFDALVAERNALGDSQKDVAKYNQITEELGRMPNPDIPAAPYVQKTEAWVALIMKRMIRYAAEHGLDRITWTTGDQQIDRYESALRQHVDEISWQKLEKGTYITARKDGDVVFGGLLDPETNKFVDGSGRGKTADEVLGREMTNSVLSEAEGSISGENLAIGGDGMRRFYGLEDPNAPVGVDKNGKPILPIMTIVANDILKKLGGGRVGQVSFGEPELSLEERTEADFQRDVNKRILPLAGQQPGFDLTPEMKESALYGGMVLFNKGALQDTMRAAQSGTAERSQVIGIAAKELEDLKLPNVIGRALFGAHWDAIKGSLVRLYNSTVSTGMNLARQSAGFKNTFDVVTAYDQRKKRLMEEAVAVMLSKWQDFRTPGQSIAKVSKALLDRTMGGYAKDSPEMKAIVARLNPLERQMFEQATDMIANRLQMEFVAEQRTFADALGKNSDAYKQWLEARQTQINQMIQNGYFPERRYGDHVVTLSVPMTDAQGNTKDITIFRDQFESQAKAHEAVLQFIDPNQRSAARQAGYKGTFFGDPAVKVQYGYKYSPDYDASLSYQQFLDMARRQGIALTQPEKERLAKATISADSVRRNRIFRRLNVAGASEDGLRILSEFGMTMANKVAYSEFSRAIADAQDGKYVTVGRNEDGSPNIDINNGSDMWSADGAQAGYYRQLTDRMVDFTLHPEQGGQWSRKLRALASIHFLGGSFAAGMVQLASLPMVSIPALSAYTPYTNAFGKVLDGMKIAVGNSALRDVAKLTDKLNVKIDAVDSVSGLRDGLIRAAEDGTTHDTEIYQIMGQTRGSMLSKSRGVRRAMDAWMYPFRETEKINRIATFIAAYKLGMEGGVDPGNPEGGKVQLQGEELYNFAQRMVYNTQNRYDEANRPALARNPIWAILFTFKSYPIFMIETISALYKESPRAAAFMLLSLAVASGVNGIPFAEDLMDLVDTVAQRLFGSPFNMQRAMKNTLKNASEAVVGADLSGVLLHGLVNELTGLSFASRVGLGNMIPGTRLGAADTDYKRTLQEMLGPVASQVSGAFEAAGSLTKGNFYEALRQGAPVAVQNALKGYEQFTRGYAADVQGRKLVDASGLEALAQSVGFSSAGLAKAYEMDRIDKQTQAFYAMVRLDFTRDIVAALRDGKQSQVREIMDSVQAWNKQYPEMPIAINASSIRRILAEAGMPLNQRTLMNMPRALRSSSEAYELTLKD